MRVDRIKTLTQLRPYRMDDLESLVYNANNKKVARYLRENFPSPFTVTDGKWWIEEGSTTEGSWNYAIEFNGEHVGGLGVTFFNNEHRHSAEVGYWLGEDHWYKGIATAAVKKISTTLFARDDIHRLFAPVVGPNTASMRVLEKCGFQREAVLRQAMTLHGNVYDEHIFGKLKTDK